MGSLEGAGVAVFLHGDWRGKYDDFFPNTLSVVYSRQKWTLWPLHCTCCVPTPLPPPRMASCSPSAPATSERRATKPSNQKLQGMYF